ncbi:hypothetical protein [Glaciibacter superstes]|uniref:hypothetical protein n=1 Tax=Glaciibacter superstes TaxID=501023 RepID=UPI0003B43DAB|nr:hypothetical protein [Glaciibacter superstes]
MSSDTPPHDSHGPDLYSGRDLQSGRTPIVDRYRLRQVLFGAVIVIALRFVTEFIIALGNLAVAAGQPSGVFGGMYVVQILIGLVSAVFFVAGAGVAGIFIAPLTASLGLKSLLGRLVIGGAFGTIATLIVGLIVTLATNNNFSYLLMNIVYSGLVYPVVDGIINTALFALGVFIARSLPSAPAMPGPALPSSAG